MKKITMTLLLTILCFTACGKADDDTSAADTSSAVSEASTATSDAAASDADTADTSADYQLSIPDDFTAVEIDGLAFCYVHEDNSSISMNVQDKDSAFSAITAEALNEALVKTFSSTYDLDITITDLYFTTEAVSGFPGYQYCFSYELEGNTITQLVIGVDAAQTYTFTYTDMSGDWIQTFEASAQTIKITE